MGDWVGRKSWQNYKICNLVLLVFLPPVLPLKFYCSWCFKLFFWSDKREKVRIPRCTLSLIYRLLFWKCYSNSWIATLKMREWKHAAALQRRLGFIRLLHSQAPILQMFKRIWFRVPESTRRVPPDYSLISKLFTVSGPPNRLTKSGWNETIFSSLSIMKSLFSRLCLLGKCSYWDKALFKNTLASTF